MQAHTVADLDRRLGQIDSAIEEAAKRGRTNVALSAIDVQRKARAALAGERQREASALADLKVDRAALGAKGRQIEAESAPIRYVAELLGVDTQNHSCVEQPAKGSIWQSCGGFRRLEVPRVRTRHFSPHEMPGRWP